MKLFVYGSLKRGKHNHDCLMEANFICTAFVRNGYNLYVGKLPYLVKEKGGMGCVGELYEINEATLNLCDYLEGHPLFYTRTKIWVTDANSGEEIEASTYLYNHQLPAGLEPRREYV